MTASDSKPSAPTSPPSSGPRRAPAGFWDRVSEGMAIGQMWEQFRSDAAATYSFYSKEVDWDELQKKKGLRKGLAVASAFFWSLLMKLSPARRVALVIALACLILGGLRYQLGDASAEVNLGFVGVLLLLLLLALELADRVTMKRDLEIARDIQRWLVPDQPPEIPGFDIAFATRPANTVAGDYYDVVSRKANDGARWLIVVADVAGKSVPAALLMATFQASLQTLSSAAPDLADLVAGLNRFVAAHSLGGMRFTTAFVAELDPRTGQFTYVNAGHNAPVLRRASGAIERLDIGGIPFGIDADAQYAIGSSAVGNGDLLVIFTDGLVEAVNEDGEEFTDARLLGALASAPVDTAAGVQARLMSALDAFVGRARQHDDTTYLILRAT